MTAITNGTARPVSVVGPCSSDYVAVERWRFADAVRDVQVVYFLAVGVLHEGLDAELTERAMFSVKELLGKAADRLEDLLDSGVDDAKAAS